MNRNNIKIAKSSLSILKVKLWKDISIKEIKKKSKVTNFDKIIKNKNDLLKEINNYFDYDLTLKCKKIETSNNKDMIFEILMTRFDILQLYRKEVISIFTYLRKRPQDLIFFLSSLLNSIILMLNFANIPTKGITGQLKIKGMMIIYISSFFVWIEDQSVSLEKTMTSVDDFLDKAGKIIKYIK